MVSIRARTCLARATSTTIAVAPGGRVGPGRASRRRRARPAASQRTTSCSTGSGSPMRSATATRELVRRPDRHRAGEPAAYLDRDAELLGDLADQRRLGRLAVLDLAARELPAAGGRGRCGSTGRQHPAVPDQRRAYDLLHGRTLRSVHAVRRGCAPHPDRRERRRDRRAGDPAGRSGRAGRRPRRPGPQGAPFPVPGPRDPSGATPSTPPTDATRAGGRRA